MRTRSRSRFIIMVTAVLLAGICRAQQPAPSAPQTLAEPAVAPEVIVALKKMGGFLRTLQAFTIHADTDIDEGLEDTGQKLQCSRVVEYYFRAPDHLCAVARLTWNPRSQLDNTLFTFQPPADAHKIVLREVAAKPESKP